jgi:hypothetical protein
MIHQPKYIRIIHIVGIAAVLVGALDPMEGSVVIAVGAALLTWHAYLTQSRMKVLYLMAACMILFGVFSLFGLSALGGFGGTSSLSIWWGLLIVPYPAGWLMVMVMLVASLISRKKRTP